MKKLFLGFTVLSVFALASCAGSPSSSSDYKKCNYLSVDDQTFVTEEGTTKLCKMVSTYSLSNADRAQIEEFYFNNFPATFSIAKYFQIEAGGPINPRTIEPEDGYILEFVITTGGSTNYAMYNLELEFETTTIYETYGEYFYSEASETIKINVHNDVKRADGTKDYDSAYVPAQSGGYVIVECVEDQFPTGNYHISTPLYDIKYEVYERYMKVGDSVVYYSFEKEEA